MPRHIAVIMDGNGRWAKARNLPRAAGHRAGVRAARRTVETCAEIGVEVLTLFAFSSENWRRPRTEVHALMELLVSAIGEELDSLIRNNIRLRVIGRLEDLYPKPRRAVEEAIARSGKNTGMILNIALSYGGRQDIMDAVRKLIRSGVDDPTESDLEHYLSTEGLPDPDLLIRTSGEMRISNFMLWQTAYSEIVVLDTLWPDFDKNHLLDAVEEYHRRERRFGRLGKPV